MAAIEGRVDPVRAWVLAAIAGTVALLGGALAFPRAVYDRFIWQYFWGPVHADAAGARCAVRAGSDVRLRDSADACATAVSRGAIVAEPGYTVVSEIGYAVILLFMLLGVWFMLRELDLGRDRAFFFALLPFMFFGGALRVVEDANVALAAGGESAISYPLSTIIISPVIYFTVFAVTLAAVLASVWLAREQRFDVQEYSRPLLWAGIAVLAGTIVLLFALAVGTRSVAFYPQMSILVLGITTLVAGGVWAGVRRFAPEITYGTAGIGFVILWGHTLDGVANVIASDWAQAIGLPFEYSAKHPVNRFIIDATQGILPPSLTATIGTAWPFLLVKIVAALAVVWLFDETIFEESPRYAILLLVAILAVGLGPGTRDMLRATFGI
ncbi:hypothetical protein BRC86_07515 [Halobacteriales archaeon QS_3_64_16]|nr:MAG: hypothetical protein BRC86_07515 [Halobacteriales archaeon QS_3_64_16]